MAKSFDELKAKMTPESRERAERIAEALRAAMRDHDATLKRLAD